MKTLLCIIFILSFSTFASSRDGEFSENEMLFNGLGKVQVFESLDTSEWFMIKEVHGLRCEYKSPADDYRCFFTEKKNSNKLRQYLLTNHGKTELGILKCRASGGYGAANVNCILAPKTSPSIHRRQ